MKRKTNKKEALRVYHKNYNKKYYQKNKNKLREKRKINGKFWRLKRKNYLKKKSKLYTINNRELLRKKSKLYRINNINIVRKREKSYAIKLTDGYIANLLEMNLRELKKYPQLIEAKRVQLKLYRKSNSQHKQ